MPSVNQLAMLAAGAAPIGLGPDLESRAAQARAAGAEVDWPS